MTSSSGGHGLQSTSRGEDLERPGSDDALSSSYHMSSSHQTCRKHHLQRGIEYQRRAGRPLRTSSWLQYKRYRRACCGSSGPERTAGKSWEILYTRPLARPEACNCTYMKSSRLTIAHASVFTRTSSLRLVNRRSCPTTFLFPALHYSLVVTPPSKSRV